MSTALYQQGIPRDWPQIQVLRRIWRAAVVLQDLHQPHFERSGVSMLEFDLLSALGNTHGLRLQDLAHAMISPAPDVARACDELEAKGLVRCEPSGAGGELVASLTHEGHRLLEQVYAPTVNYSGQLLDSSLSRHELEALAGLLEKLLTQTRPPK